MDPATGSLSLLSHKIKLAISIIQTNFAITLARDQCFDKFVTIVVVYKVDRSQNRVDRFRLFIGFGEVHQTHMHNNYR